MNKPLVFNRVARQMSRILGLLGFVAAVVPASAARADIGDVGVVSVSVDRLFGFNQTKLTRSTNNTESSYSRTDFSLLVPATSTAYSTPRLAIDLAVADRVTVGGALGVIISSASSNQTVGSVTAETSSGSGTGIILAPRGGYLLPLGSSAKLWLRAGITYFQTSSKGDNTDSEVSTHGFALDLEPTFLYMLGSHVGMTIGAVIDLPLSGESKTTIGSASTSTDTKVRNLGLVAGLALPF
jgi:hypothetical protein